MPIIRAADKPYRKSAFPSHAHYKQSTTELSAAGTLALESASSHKGLSNACLNQKSHSTSDLLWTPQKPEKLIPSAASQASTLQDASDGKEKKKKRKSWLATLSKATEPPKAPARAWIGGHQGKVLYNVSNLMNAHRVPELWNSSGNTLVYLYPNVSDSQATFKIHSCTIASSLVLTALIRTSSASARQINASDTFDIWPHSESTLTTNQDYVASDTDKLTLVLPLNLSSNKSDSEFATAYEDVDALVAARNLFAFLHGQSLVCTEKRPSLFSAFLEIADLLKTYAFTNIDGSTMGQIPAQSFDSYIKELNLADVRNNPEKTIEALVLGERMRSITLFNEAFTHAVGKYRSIQDFIKIPEALAKWRLLSVSTRNRLERAAIDLDTRRQNADARLSDFEFPSVFAGIMSSKTAAERKHINFDAWKGAFAAMRKQVLGYYRSHYGSWPPKANKKTQRALPGLNRLVLKTLYRDFADLYDFWVDRTALTSRNFGSDLDDSQMPAHRAIRRVCDEYDRSVPPVQPAVPFDVPILPSLFMIRSDQGVESKKDFKARNKKLSAPDIDRLLDNSVNTDARAGSQRSPFVEAMSIWERKQARGCTVNEMCDLRCGAWIFLYAVMQSLPMLVVDAPGLQFHAGVEYFLCVPPRSGVPWAGGQSGAGRQSYYRIAGDGERVVSLPSDLIEHGVEGIYRRSHCWLMAAKWSHDPYFMDTTSALEHNHGYQPSSQLQNQDHAAAGAAQFTVKSPWVDTYSYTAPPPPDRLPGSTLPPPSLALQPADHECQPSNYLSTHPQLDIHTISDSRPDTGHSTNGSSHRAHQGSSPYQSRPSTPTQALQRGRQRDRVLALGLEELPFTHPLSSQATKYARDASRSSGARTADVDAGEMPEATGMTFDDIIAGISHEKAGQAKIGVRGGKKSSS